MPRAMHRPDEVSAGGVVVRRSREGWEVCLIRVGERWGLPKGNLDRGETPEQAALREVAEETGLPLDGLRIVETLARSDYAYRRQGRLVFKTVHQYLIEATGEAPLRPQAEEVDEAAWLPLDEARRRAAFKDTVKALDEAERFVTPKP